MKARAPSVALRIVGLGISGSVRRREEGAGSREHQN